MIASNFRYRRDSEIDDVCLFSQSSRFNINISSNNEIYCDLSKFYPDKNINDGEEVGVMRFNDLDWFFEDFSIV